jgi:hypothetical protein
MNMILKIDKKHWEIKRFLGGLNHDSHVLPGTIAGDRGVQLPQNIQVPVNRDHTE